VNAGLYLFMKYIDNNNVMQGDISCGQLLLDQHFNETAEMKESSHC